MATKNLCFRLSLMLNLKCAKFYLILTRKCLNYMGFKYLINANPSCDVTTFVKGAQNVQFSCRIFSQDFRDFESSYLWNGSRY